MILNTPAQQIDHVLAIFKDHASRLNFTELEIKIQHSKIVVEPSVLNRIIDKLIRDNYLFVWSRPGFEDYYNITFERHLFIGYEKQSYLIMIGLLKFTVRKSI